MPIGKGACGLQLAGNAAVPDLQFKPSRLITAADNCCLPPSAAHAADVCETQLPVKLECVVHCRCVHRDIV